MFSSTIVPAVIPQDAATLSYFLEQIGSVPEIHIDVVDGKFVPFTSWPYEPQDDPKTWYHRLASYTLEVDLMVQEPLRAARSWLEAGADMLVFHIETITHESLATFATEHDVTIGVSALNDTPYDELARYADIADYVQVMGIRSIGAQGQPFDDAAYERITQLRRDNPDTVISLDGSVNRQTIEVLKQLNLSRYIVGSAITKVASPREAYLDLCRIVSSTGESFSFAS
jgi:ribulose-phosphate 3-epimerase